VGGLGLFGGELMLVRGWLGGSFWVSERAFGRAYGLGAKGSVGLMVLLGLEMELAVLLMRDG